MCENCVRILEEKKLAPYVCYSLKKVKENGILIHKSNHEKQKTVRTPENIAVESVCEAPSTSIRRRSRRH